MDTQRKNQGEPSASRVSQRVLGVRHQSSVIGTDRDDICQNRSDGPREKAVVRIRDVFNVFSLKARDKIK